MSIQPVVSESGSAFGSEGENNDNQNSNKRDLSLNSSVEQEPSKTAKIENDSKDDEKYKLAGHGKQFEQFLFGHWNIQVLTSEK